MQVFVAWDGYEALYGVFLSLAEAVAQNPSVVDEFEIGNPTRVRSYDTNGELWWENGKRV